MENKNLKIGILGLGLIGGSILKKLYSLKKYYLVSVSKSSYKKAKEFSNVSGDDITLLSSCDVVFVCSKMDETLENLNRLESVLSEDTVVLDVCSLKKFIDKKFKFKFAPCHPMAGTEFSGFENSFEELFMGAKWVFTGYYNDILLNLVKELGANPLFLDSSLHDKYAAEISHFPALLSIALFDSVEDEAKIMASSGFRDTTRLSVQNSELIYSMLKLNKENIISSYKKFNESFLKLIDMNEDDFKETVSKIATKRRKMYDKDGRNVLK